MKITMQHLYALAQRPSGVTTAEVREAFALAQDNAKGRLDAMASSGRLERRKVPLEGRTMWRYFADPAVSWALADQRWKERQRKAFDERLQKANIRLKSAYAAEAEEAKKRALKTETRTVDGRKVKVTFGPSCNDARYSVDYLSSEKRLFESMKPGQYLPSESAASRAYS